MQVFGHRGAAGEAPENTLAGFRHAADRGVTRVELDLHLSADQQLVVVHDSTLQRTTGVCGKIADFSARQLAAMDARHSGPPWPRKSGIPTLATVLRQEPRIKQYQLEVKAGSKVFYRKVIDCLQQLFPSAGSARKHYVTCSDPRLLAMLAELAPHFQRGLVTTLASPWQQVAESQCQLLVPHWSLCDKRFVAAARRRDLQLSVWTVNDLTHIRRLYRLGVDSIITDYPSMALPFVGSLLRL